MGDRVSIRFLYPVAVDYQQFPTLSINAPSLTMQSSDGRFIPVGECSVSIALFGSNFAPILKMAAAIAPAIKSAISCHQAPGCLAKTGIVLSIRALNGSRGLVGGLSMIQGYPQRNQANPAYCNPNRFSAFASSSV